MTAGVARRQRRAVLQVPVVRAGDRRARERDERCPRRAVRRAARLDRRRRCRQASSRRDRASSSRRSRRASNVRDWNVHGDVYGVMSSQSIVIDGAAGSQLAGDRSHRRRVVRRVRRDHGAVDRVDDLARAPIDAEPVRRTEPRSGDRRVDVGAIRVGRARLEGRRSLPVLKIAHECRSSGRFRSRCAAERRGGERCDELERTTGRERRNGVRACARRLSARHHRRLPRPARSTARLPIRRAGRDRRTRSRPVGASVTSPSPPWDDRTAGAERCRR